MTGRKAIIHDEQGNEVVGEVVYEQKADYEYPFKNLNVNTEINPADYYHFKKAREKEDFKVGESVIGRKALIHDEQGNEVVGDVVYVRKAIYKEDPFK